MFQSAIAFLETQGVPTPFATAIIRLLLGSICGGLIGLEREMKGRRLYGCNAGHGDERVHLR